MELSSRVRAGIARLFEEREHGEVRELLAASGKAENLHLAILKLSRGRVSKVRSLVADAQRDYRDVLSWAEQPSRTYVVGVLLKGPRWPAGKFEHLEQESIRRWKAAGQIIIGGLFRDSSERLGLYIFSVETVEEARALTEEDPGVRAGILAFEFHRWMTADGLQVGVPAGFDI